jgi:hypothetical protein
VIGIGAVDKVTWMMMCLFVLSLALLRGRRVDRGRRGGRTNDRVRIPTSIHITTIHMNFIRITFIRTTFLRITFLRITFIHMNFIRVAFIILGWLATAGIVTTVVVRNDLQGIGSIKCTERAVKQLIRLAT